MSESGVGERLFEALSVLPGGPVTAPLDLGERARRRLRLRRGAQLGTAAVAVTGLVVSVAFLSSGQRSATPDIAPTTEQGRGADANELAHGTWQVLPAAPIAPRSDPVAVWTGSRMIVWGGGEGAHVHDDGAAYDPASRRWSKLPASPLSARTDAAAVWTGKVLFIWGGRADDTTRLADGATYDPAGRRWHRLPASPLSGRSGAAAAVLDGRVVVLGGQPSDAPHGAGDVAEYDPTRDRWSAMPSLPATDSPGYPPSPLPSAGPVTVTPRDHRYDGQVGVVATPEGIFVQAEWQWQMITGHNTIAMDAGVDRFLLTRDGFRRAAAAGAPTSFGDPVWTGHDVIVAASPRIEPGFGGPRGFNFHGSRLDLATGSWSTLAHGPADDLGGVSLWTGSAMLTLDTRAQIGGQTPADAVHPGEAAAWDPVKNRWQSVPRPPAYGASAHIWTGRALLEWGGDDGAGEGGPLSEGKVLALVPGRDLDPPPLPNASLTEDCGDPSYWPSSIDDVLCPDGKAKLLAYAWLLPRSPHVFALGPDANAQTVHTALCLDMSVNQASQAIERSSLIVAEAMFGGWPFEKLRATGYGIIRC